MLRGTPSNSLSVILIQPGLLDLGVAVWLVVSLVGLVVALVGALPERPGMGALLAGAGRAASPVVTGLAAVLGVSLFVVAYEPMGRFTLLIMIDSFGLEPPGWLAVSAYVAAMVLLAALTSWLLVRTLRSWWRLAAQASVAAGLGPGVAETGAATTVVLGLGAWALVFFVHPVWEQAPPGCHARGVRPDDPLSENIEWPPIDLPPVASVEEVAALFGVAPPLRFAGAHPSAFTLREHDGGVRLARRGLSHMPFEQLTAAAEQLVGQAGGSVTGRSVWSPGGERQMSIGYDRPGGGGVIDMAACGGALPSVRLMHTPTVVESSVDVGPERVGDCQPAAHRDACALLYDTARLFFREGSG